MEQSIWEFFVNHRPRPLVEAAKVLAFLGDETVLLPVTLLLALWALWRGRRTVSAFAPFVVMVATYVAVGISKTLIGRERPPVSGRLVEATTASMPSGHASYAAALAMTAWILSGRHPHRTAIRITGTVLAGLAGAARLVLGVHWAGDVVAGWLLGDLVALGVVTLMMHRLQSSA